MVQVSAYVIVGTMMMVLPSYAIHVIVNVKHVHHIVYVPPVIIVLRIEYYLIIRVYVLWAIISHLWTICAIYVIIHV